MQIVIDIPMTEEEIKNEIEDSRKRGLLPTEDEIEEGRKRRVR